MRSDNGHRWRRASIVGITSAVALAFAAPAQAVELLPGDTAIGGTSTNATLKYGGATITCNSEVGGRTTKPASAFANLTTVNFKACVNSTEYTTEVLTSASGTSPFKLVATEATGGGSGKGHMEIPVGGTVKVRVYFLGFFLGCEFTASGPQTLVGTFNATTDVLTMNATVSVKRTGGAGSEEQCGPKESTATYTADYSTVPANLEIK